MLKKIKELLKDVGVYGITSIASQFIGFLLLPLYTSYLSPTDYGILAMVGIVKSLFITLGNLGLKSAVMRFVSKSKNAGRVRSILCNYLSGSFVLFICFPLHLFYILTRHKLAVLGQQGPLFLHCF